MIANEDTYWQRRPKVWSGWLTKIVIASLSVCVAMVVAGASVRRAEASLGGSIASVTSDAQKLGAVTASGPAAAAQSISSSPQSAVQSYVLRTSTGEKYTYNEFSTANNLRVREFVRPDGKVFGLAWQGHGTPDLQLLLGTYFDGWHKAIANSPHIGLHRAAVHSSSLVVEMGGPMGFVVGRAWAPKLVPAGVDARNVVQ